MRQWMWTLLIAGGLGLGATACRQHGDVGEVKNSRLGEEREPEQEAPLVGKGWLVGTDVAAQEFLGTVTSTQRGGFTAKDDDGVEHPFVVNPKTRIVRDGQPVALAQLHEGSQVHTTYDEKQGHAVAAQVDIYAGTPSRDAPAPSGR